MALYSSAFDPVPVASDAFAWPDVVDALEELCDREAEEGREKTGLMAWAPHLLTTPHRTLDHVAHVSMHVIDVDHMTDAGFDALRDRIQELCVSAVVYGSPSDGLKPGRRMRVVIPSASEIPVSECRDMRYRVAEHLGLRPGCGVEGAIDAAKIFFAGRLHGTPTRYFEVFEGGTL